ncbi:hypothetical protein AC578_10671 [Pseudocercospora eumusae]|uniref:SPT2 chromatin protein n=1 Tax=Pseudocercospora eumusae TaxID=321146 RepID=A0A139HJC4_9PEZI|nr:hypothetical protein AC578_10671 [Pseudocercospora eumusae]
MTGFNFNNLLNSIGKPGSSPSPKPTTSLSKPPPGAPSTAKPQAVTNGVKPRPVPANVAAGVKRKSEDQSSGPQAKVVRTEVKVPVRPGQNGQVASTKPAASASTATAASYKGTSRPLTTSQPAKAAAKPAAAAPKPAGNATAANAAPAAPKGFAAILAQAKAAQEASKAATMNTIKHKPVERLTKKERMRLREEAKQKGGGKGGKAAAADRSRSGTPSDPKAAAKRAPDTGYKGTMKKAVVAPPTTSYTGTMKKAVPGAAPKKDPKKGLGQDKYGGYASWSDLSAAEDEDEEGYDSYESDDMEAGFDDVEGEEQLALKSARKEDLEALQEEERHRREKEERKRKLAALSKTAAAAKKRY